MTGPGSTGSTGRTGRKALQAALAAEHAAVYAYGVVGGVFGPESERGADAASGYATHRGRRDQLTARIGSAAVAAEPAYRLPFEVSGPARARRLAVHVERRCAAVYADVVARTGGNDRAYAADALTDCAVRQIAWGAEPEPFPGLPSR